MNAAAAIHAALGVKAIESAALVGERSGVWSLYRNGKKSPTEAKVAGWLKRLLERGVAIALLRTAGDCSAKVLPST